MLLISNFIHKISKSCAYRWLYLEPILAGDEGELGIKFRKVDVAFKQAARILESDPRLSVVLQSTRLRPMLDSISEQLNNCQSALNDYMDEKRTIFPRLYFLNDDDLLELLGQARAGDEGIEAVMHSHLKKLFPGITGVRLAPGKLSINALTSHFGETLQLDRPVGVDSPVEVWLKNLETEIRSTLKTLTRKSLRDNILQEPDALSLPTQVLCVAQSVRFTELAEKAIVSKELHQLKDTLERESSRYAHADVADEKEKYKRQALILQWDYHILAVQSLIESNVVSTNDWLWQKQLRFYSRSNDEIVAKMALAEVQYSYEYLGVQTGQFVRSDVTDECFLILTQSLHLGLVGNPFGPAGTGKTESVKALGALFGRLVLVFNCDEAMDAACLARLLRGLALSGAWGCLDEFNRLTAEALAAAAHQLAALMAGSQGDRKAVLDGKTVSVSAWCGVMVTMNPLGRGYGGRRELPTALAALLRPLALRPPDARDLAARLLAALHVPTEDARALADALQNVFSLASALLSGSRHYDWGLRALKAAVSGCGAALAARACRSRSDRLATLRAVLRLTNVSKLTQHDAHRFEKIISMVFTGVPEEESTTGPLDAALGAAVKKLNLIHNDFQIQKCKELYEQIQQRMGVAIVGPPGCGKTTIRRILKTALILQGESVSEWVIYPKAMRRSWLLGRAEPDTRQWTDGVVPAVATHAANQPSEVRSWMVYDGDVDPQWAEALNSLLDDNRLLALAGARVLLPARASALFETHHLDRASPATVSRLAIILLSEEHNCAPLVVQNWMLNADFDDDTAKISLPVLHSAINKCLLWLRANGSETHFKVQDIPLVQLIIAQFEDLVQNTLSRSAYASAEDMVQLALERSITGVVVDSAMDRFLEEVIGGVRFKQMNENVGLEEFESDKLVPSPRVLCAASCLRAALRAGRHALVLGPDASGKSLLVEQVLKELNGNVISVECTPLLEPADILTQLKRNNVLRSGGGSGAGGEPATLVVRGLQRARLDVWGDCPLHAFLLQVAGGGGAWECAGGEGPQWRRARVRLLATATTPSAVAPRLLAILSLIPLGEPDEDEIVELAKNRLRENIINNIPDGEINLLAKNIGLLYKDVTETFTRQPHYRWNASHVDTLCEDIKWYSATSSADVLVALNAESNMIFRERLLTEDERSRYNSISRKYIACGSGQVYLKPRSRGDGVYLQVVGYDEWSQNINQLINQCLTDDENAFGDDRVEACAELAVFCPAIALAMMGGVAVCVGGAGAGGPAAARLVCAAIGATVHFVVPGPPGTSSIDNTFKNALLTASEGARACVVLHAEGEERDMGESYNEDGDERSSAAATLSRVEALVRAHSVSALPDALARLAPSGQHSDTLRDIKRNLGIVICIDKDEISLGELMERFPMLHSNGRLVWVERWSEPTLSSLPALLTQRLMKENGQEMNKERLAAVPVEGFVSIYRSLRCERTRAPCKYVRLITAYCHIATRKQEALQQRKKMLAAGVEALRRARSEVATLQKDAAEQETALSVEQAKANQALEQISATVRANTDKKEEMHELKRSIEVENEKLQIRKEEIEEELSVVEPEIAAARAAVGDIRPEALSEIRSLRAPPDVVRDVLEGVLRLMGVADTSWHSMKNFLSKRGIKEDIRHLDAGSVSDEAAAAVARLVERRPASFEESTARRASAACAPLAAWVRAHLAHAEALRHVRPLRDAQENLKRKVRASESQLSALADGLASVEERVSALTRQLGGHTRAAAALELRLHAAAAAIQRATTLLQQLAHEYDAWEEQLEDITKELAEVNVRSLLAAAYIIYLPELTEPQARDMVREWAAVLGHDSLVFSVMNFLSTPETQLKWEADGLPADQSSVKNAIIIDQYLSEQNYGFTPLIVDPEGDVEAWLRKTLKDTPTDFVSQHSDKLKTALQYAAKLRRVLVITDVEEYAWWWGAVVGAGGGGPRALLVARSPLRTPPPPRFAAQLAIIHFAPRLHSLIDQLVHYTIQKQNPSLNDRYKEIKLQKAILQKQQYELQENLLKELSDNRDILHDENLMESLQKTRATSSTIASALSAAHDLEEEVGGACAKYTPTAARAAALTLAVKQLGVHSPLVTLPLEAVQQVFLEAVLRSAEPKDVNKDETVRYLMRRIIDRVLLSLHKRDKYVVVLHLLKQVYDDVVPDGLWKIFINHISVAQDKSSALEIKQHYHWIGDEFLNKLAQIKMQYEGLFDRLCLDKSDVWLEFQRSGDMAAIRHLQLEPFERVVAVAALRPQSAYRAVVAFVGHVLGGVRSGAALERAEQWTSCTRPALLLGAHAALQLTVHAQARSRSLTEVGIDEGLSAWEAALRNCRNGGWLAIVVGASAFPRDLYTFVSGLSSLPMEERPSEEFRLWLVTEERDVPPALAHACLGVVLEAPEGVKYNVCGTLGAWAGVRAPPPLLRHFAALALFHAVVQERRAYLPLGWSRWYAWEWGEVSASRRAAEGAGAGRAARELCGALYAARAGEARDRRVVHALLRTLLDASLQRNWRPPSMPAPLPLYTDISTYMEAFSALPDMDPPELLALPANCRVAWEQNAADNIVAGLREYDTTVIIRKHESTAPVKTILALWKKLMAGSPLIRGEFGVDAASDGNSGWWACVCAAEARDAAVVTRTVHAALARLAHAPPTANHALDKVPDEWQLLWPGPEIPELYIKEFCHRASAAVDRLQECRRSGGDIPKELDVRTLMRVSRVLSALRARAAERTALPPHALVLAVTWGAHSVEEDGVVVRGLRMSGGEWVANGGGAGEVRPAPATAPPDTPAPPLLLRYVPAAHEFSTTEDGADSRVGFRACVYSDASRSAVVWRARAPLATLFTPDMAELHALALHVAPV